MKPNSQISRQPRYRGEEHSSFRLRSNHRATDYHFRSPATDRQVGRAASIQKRARHILTPRFRDLSNKFLGAETTRNYVVEVLFFAIIVGVSAWPIVSMLEALEQLLK